nr:MAG TPA: hypothetical protein [Caudoviricetes sp.]
MAAVSELVEICFRLMKSTRKNLARLNYNTKKDYRGMKRQSSARWGT